VNVLIVGASRGIGLELVRQYRAAGDRVVATARQEDGLQRIRDLAALALALDVNNLASVNGLVRRLDGEQFDVIVYVAGVLTRGDAGLPPSQEDFDLVMQTNVLAPMRVLPTMVDVLAPQGKLALLSSRMGSVALRTNGSDWLYRASKAAVNSVVKDMSFALQGKGVCVTMHPGWVRTDMGGPNADLSVEQSVSDIRATLAGLTLSSNGSFLNHDGQVLAW
jgi:NAD(P)-dependent dehydrogenase (short-subunit alcohol dehydrogenase family)